jgi:uncharacterized protein (TIGR02646 family)
MRFIDKNKRCDTFDNHIETNKAYLGKWNLPTDVKISLHNHILLQQKGLCVYCQQSLPLKMEAENLPAAMIEHIRPRDKYKELIYEFSNLAVACKKYKIKDENIDFCEDKKDNEYDEQLFLNPHELEDIEDYFEYDGIEGKIFAKNNNLKANYMIKKVLNLDHSDLNGMRKSQYDNFLGMNIEEVEKILLDENAEQLPAFFSMLKQFYL